MAANSPFQAITKTYVFDATTGAGTALQIAATSGSTTYEQYLVANNGGNGVWVTLASTAAGAVQTIPVVGTPGNAVWIEAGNTRVLTGPSQAWFNAQTAASTTELYITGGDGILTGVASVGEGSGGPTANVNVTNTSLPVAGTVASGAADSGNPVKVGGVFNTTLPTLTNGQRGDLQLGSRGGLNVSLLAASGTQAATVSTQADAQAAQGALYVVSQNAAFNGASYDRVRNNVDTAALITLTAQAAGTVNSADQTNYNGRGVVVGINVTVATAETLTINIQGKDAASGVYYTLLSSTALAITGFTALTLYPGATTTANVSISGVLPRTWRVQAVVTGTSVSATVGASVIV